MKWRPIETAPKGPDILIICMGAPKPTAVVAHWRNGENCWCDGSRDTVDELINKNGLTVSDIGFYARPTHWMPLPEPPAP